MKKIVVDIEKCVGCGHCEEVCSKAWFKKEDRMLSNIRVCEQPGGKVRVDVCDQCGECAQMCAAMAIAPDKNGIYRIDKKKCVGCLICVAECLKDNMHYNNDQNYPFKCIACGLCVKECPAGALSIVQE